MSSPTHTSQTKILVDVNIFEDVFRYRSGWKSSLAAIGKVKNKEVKGYISALTSPILYFFRRKFHADRKARRMVRQFISEFHVISLNGRILDFSYKSKLPDFEDAIQFFSAKEAQVDYIVTRNKKDFQQKDIVVVTPEELLKQLTP